MRRSASTDGILVELLKGLALRHRGAALAAVLSVPLLIGGCGAAEENPLGVNGAVTEQGSTESSVPRDGSQADPVGNLGDDPLNVGLDGAELCGVQPQDSRLRYTVMLHNPTLETFTFGEMALGDAQGLDVISSMVQTANREGHNHGGAELESHEEHSAAPTPAATQEPIGPPVPAEGYRFEPDAHVNIIVTVELADGVTNGTADNILVNFSTPEREYSVAHNLKIEVDATSCA